jgi:hypothetical protein
MTLANYGYIHIMLKILAKPSVVHAPQMMPNQLSASVSLVGTTWPKP